MKKFRASALALCLAIAITIPFGAGASTHVLGYKQGDEAVTALNILPPGQGHHLNILEALPAFGGSHPPHNTDQIGRYEGLIRKAPTLSAANLKESFTDASFGVAPGDVGRTYSPGNRSGLTVIRDLSKGVPHVYGQTRSDVMFGAGYVSAEDRLFVMDALRHLGRGRLTELLGSSPSNLASDRAVRLAADYTEDELVTMGERAGTRAVADVADYSAGINHFINEALLDPTKLPAIYPALQTLPKLWKPTDSVAIAAYIGGVFSVGGGGQIANSLFMKKLIDGGMTYAEARTVMRDFSFANDLAAPTSTPQSFLYNFDLGPVDPAKVAFPDDPAALLAQISALPATIDTPLGPIPLPFAGGGASNALLVAPSHSESGNPIAVMGPQVGYFSPEIFMEIDMHGPGIHARGGAFPGISLYVLIGRGDNYAWSATTAFGDHNDIRAVKLCEPVGSATTNSRYYLNGASCDPIYRRTDTWLTKPSAAGQPNSLDSAQRVVVSMTTERTRHGIVQARGTVGGQPVAFVRERTSYGKDLDSAATYVDLMDPAEVTGVNSLKNLFSRFNYSFNWHLIAPDGVGFYTTGTYPKLATGIDPELPFWGDSALDATGYLTQAEHPQGFNPASGIITNWNNKQAPGFRAPDNWWSYGPVGRKQLLDDGIADVIGDGKVNLVELVQAMEDAATRDLRGAKVLPSMLDVIGPQSDSRISQALGILSTWEASGAHRRDLDGDGQYDNSAAVALMDAWWLNSLKAAFGPTLGSAFEAVPNAIDDAPGPGGSAYLEGWYGHLKKDLDRLLGSPVNSWFSRQYCGNGVLAACRAALLASLDASIATLETKFGGDPTTWDANEAGDKIKFSGLDLTGPGPMAWQNRPTFQQVLEFQKLS